jgi:transcriptional regulator with XRE-family HTH domain
MASTSPFGEHLRREREMRGVSLEELSSATRISTKFLTAIETGHWEQLPGGAFNRGFIRSASRYLGLDEDGMVAEYSLETNGNGYSTAQGAGGKSARRRDYLSRVAGLAVLLACVGLAGWFLASRIVHRLRSRPAIYGAPLGEKSTAASAPFSASMLPLRLVVIASGPDRVRVIADGKAVFDGEVEAREQKSFGARQVFNVSAGDSSAVRLELNGQPVSPIGPAGRPGSVTLTAKDLKSPAGGVH